MKTKLFFGLLCGAAAICAESSAEEKSPIDLLDRTPVAIPFGEVRALIEAVAAEKSPEPAPPPVRSAITRADYQLDLAAREGRAVVVVATFGEGWQEVPIFDAALEVSEVAAGEAAILSRDGSLVLLANGSGEHEVELRFAIPETFVSGGREWGWDFPASTTGRVTWSGGPDGRRMMASGAAGKARDGVLLLSPRGGKLSLRLIEDVPRVSTQWEAVVETLATRDGSFLQMESRILLAGMEGSGQQVDLALPMNASRIDIEGEDIGRHQSNAAGEAKSLGVEWLTPGVLERVRNFALNMTTDFGEIDFPAGVGSPTVREREEDGWALAWNYPDVIGPQSAGMAMPNVLNAGPVASRIAFFAPVSLLFFFAVLLILGTVRGINLHPMNYFFLAAGCFAFQLLFAYLVDLLPIGWSFGISAGVSLLLVNGYLGLVGGREILVVSLPAQAAYMVLFSYSFFFDGLSGITIAIGAVITLAILMATTAKIDWARKFSKPEKSSPPPPVPQNV